MKAEEFLALSTNERAQIVWDQGRYLETAFYYGYTINLHSLNSMFVEVYYSSQSNCIEKVELANDQALKKYLNSIHLL